MSSIWQKFKNASETGAQQTVTFVTNVLNRQNYADLDKDATEDVIDVNVLTGCGSSENLPQERESEDGDSVDAGVSRTKRFTILSEVSLADETVTSVDENHTKDVVICENAQNEMLEINNRIQSISSPEIQETTPRDQSVCDVNGNTDNSTSEETSNIPNIGNIKLLTSVKTSKITPVFRRRRNSYDKALAEMRDRHDRVFTDVMDYTVDSPAVIPVDVSHQNIDSGITHRRSDSLDSQVSTRPKSNNSSVSIRRQISSAIPNDLPSVIKLAKSRSYAKLGDDVIEPDFEQNDVSANGKWHASFPVDAKSKSKGRKKSKKVLKKSRRAVRVAWKWIKRGFIGYASSFNYGVPMNVAMYGGSNRSKKRAYYDYR